MDLEFKRKTEELIDNLKAICGSYGLGNDGNEFKIITQVFLYKFLNDKFGYEIKLREALTEIWLMLFELSRPMREKKGEHNKSNDKIKLMMIYIHEHYREKISIPELAAAAYLSERECYRVFHDCLHMTPVEYIKAYRLQAACQMLAKGQEAVTVISHECGLGSSSYFGKVFREYAYCSPTEYRKKWQNSDM